MTKDLQTYQYNKMSLKMCFLHFIPFYNILNLFQGMRSKEAEIARRYREHRDADPERRTKYLEKEMDKWKKDRDWKEEGCQ